MAVLLEDGHAEAVEGVDIAGVVVAGQVVDALAHLIGGLVGKGDAQDVAGQNAQLIHQVGKPPGEGPGFARPGAGDDPDEALRGGDGLPLGPVQVQQYLFHLAASLLSSVHRYVRRLPQRTARQNALALLYLISGRNQVHENAALYKMPGDLPRLCLRHQKSDVST